MKWGFPSTMAGQIQRRFRLSFQSEVSQRGAWRTKLYWQEFRNGKGKVRNHSGLSAILKMTSSWLGSSGWVLCTPFPSTLRSERCLYFYLSPWSAYVTAVNRMIGKEFPKRWRSFFFSLGERGIKHKINNQEGRVTDSQTLLNLQLPGIQLIP